MAKLRLSFILAKLRRVLRSARERCRPGLKRGGPRLSVDEGSSRDLQLDMATAHRRSKRKVASRHRSWRALALCSAERL